MDSRGTRSRREGGGGLREGYAKRGFRECVCGWVQTLPSFASRCVLNKTTPVGFEPTRGDPIGLAGRRLNRSAKVSLTIMLSHVVMMAFAIHWSASRVTLEGGARLICSEQMLAGNDPPRTRTWNLRLRRPTPYPLGQRATCSSCSRPREFALCGRPLQETNIANLSLALIHAQDGKHTYKTCLAVK